MAAAIAKPEPGPSGGAASSSDLRARVLEHLEPSRRPGELVRVTQVGRQNFRVNWLTSSVQADRTMPTYRMTRSQFIRVEEIDGGTLKVTDVTR